MDFIEITDPQLPDVYYVRPESIILVSLMKFANLGDHMGPGWHLEINLTGKIKLTFKSTTIEPLELIIEQLEEAKCITSQRSE